MRNRFVLLISLLPLASASAMRSECGELDPVLAGSSFVLVQAPAAGARFESGATVAGCARTRDGAVAWRLEGRDGRKLGEGKVAGGGEGRRGPVLVSARLRAHAPRARHPSPLRRRERRSGGQVARRGLALVLAPAGPPTPPLLFARYAGKLPCADCGGIATELELFGELERDPRTIPSGGDLPRDRRRRRAASSAPVAGSSGSAASSRRARS